MFKSPIKEIEYRSCPQNVGYVRNPPRLHAVFVGVLSVRTMQPSILSY